MRELTYNNSRKSMLPRDYTKSEKFIESHYAVLAAIAASLGAFNIGTCLGWSSIAINIMSSKTFPLSFDNMGTREVSWIIAIFALGAGLAPLIVYKLWRFIGSKFFILMGCGFLITSWVLLAIHESLVTILCARMLAGLGAGCLHFLLPIYAQDISSSELRNIIDYIWHSFLGAGLLFEFCAGISGNMQVSNIVSVVAPIILLGIFIFMPESPRYLCAKGRTNAAKEILRKYREIDDETEQEIHIWSSKKLAITSFRTIFKNASKVRRLVPTFGLIIFDQVIGVWAAFLYCSWIFKITDGELSPEYYVIIIAGIYLISTFILKLLRINLNDKRTLIWSGVLKTILLISLGLYVHYKGSHGQLDDYNYFPLWCYGAFISLYGLGLTRICWKGTRILSSRSEYFTVRALCTTLNWTILVILSRAYPRLVETVGIGWMFWFMGISCLCLTLFAIFLIPDIDKLNTKYVLDEEDAIDIPDDEQI